MQSVSDLSFASDTAEETWVTKWVGEGGHIERENSLNPGDSASFSKRVKPPVSDYLTVIRKRFN